MLFNRVNGKSRVILYPFEPVSPEFGFLSGLNVTEALQLWLYKY